jgi:hypothetical protein
MGSDNDGDVVIVDQENDNAKHLSLRKVICQGNQTESLEEFLAWNAQSLADQLFPSPGTLPKVKGQAINILFLVHNFQKFGAGFSLFFVFEFCLSIISLTQ